MLGEGKKGVLRTKQRSRYIIVERWKMSYPGADTGHKLRYGDLRVVFLKQRIDRLGMRSPERILHRE